MAEAIPNLDIELPEVDQVALVVENLKDGMDRYGSILGLGPWDIHRFEPPALSETTYRGQDVEYGMLLALADTGSTMIELIQPTQGPNIYRDHLDAHGEGLHHVAYFDWSADRTYEVIDAFEKAGMGVLQSGNFKGTDFWYFDTADQLNGLIFETAIRRNTADRDPYAVYPDQPFPSELAE